MKDVATWNQCSGNYIFPIAFEGFRDKICIIIHIIFYYYYKGTVLHFLVVVLCSGRVIDGSLGLKTCTCGQQKMHWSEHATIKGSINSGGMWGRSSTSFRLGAAAQELKRSKKQKTKKLWLMRGDNERGEQEGTEARNSASLFWIQYKKCTPFSWVFACTSAAPLHPSSPLLVWSSLL